MCPTQGLGQGELVWREEEGKSLLLPRYYELDGDAKTAPRVMYSKAEVAKHKAEDDLWVIVDKKVYDVTSVLKWHPGGLMPLLHMGGKDATDGFNGFHPSRVFKQLLPNYYLGDVVDQEDCDITEGFRAIHQRLLREGKFETRMSFYVSTFAWLAALAITAVTLTLASERFPGQHLVAAVALAIFWQQTAFVGHDIGHNGISHRRSTDTAWGVLAGNFLTGVGIGWWKHSHNIHHVVPNSMEHDPDIQHMPIFAVTPKIFADQAAFRSTFHERDIAFDAAAQLLLPLQHYLFYPVMAVARFNLYVLSFLRLFTRDRCEKRGAQLLATLGFVCWYAALVASMPEASLLTRALYVLLSHAVAGVLHVQICLSHFDLDTYHGHAMDVAGAAADDWFRLQLRTTQNIDCPEWLDWFHGGLQFQIEHHLWPRLPRHNLRYARTLVKEFCEAHDVVYVEKGWIQAQKDMISAMKRTAARARELGAGAVDLRSLPIVEGFYAQG